MDPPTSLLHVIVDAALVTLHPHLQALRDQLEGCRRLHLDMRFLDGSTQARHRLLPGGDLPAGSPAPGVNQSITGARMAGRTRPCQRHHPGDGRTARRSTYALPGVLRAHLAVAYTGAKAVHPLRQLIYSKARSSSRITCWLSAASTSTRFPEPGTPQTRLLYVLRLAYAELHCHSYYSLLDGASSPEALVHQALACGLDALALTDHDSLAGAIRFSAAAQSAGLHTVIGAEITLVDGCHLTLLAESQHGYANLCRLLTASRLDTTAPQPDQVDEDNWLGKVDPSLDWSYLEAHHTGLIALTGCRRGPLNTPLLQHDMDAAHRAADRLLSIFGSSNIYVELHNHMLPGDDALIRRLLAISKDHRLPVVATNNVHYAARNGAMLHDALTAIRHNTSLAALRKDGLLAANTNRHLATPAEMATRFRELPDAIANTVEIARRCQVSLDFSNQRMPRFITPNGENEFAYLYRLCHDNLAARYPALKPAVLKQLAHELDVIEQAGLAGYFLIVWDIVRFAREARHPLPGARLCGQLHRRLPAQHHQHRPAPTQLALRAIPQHGQIHYARHRRRLRSRPPRRGHPVRLPSLRRSAHRYGLQHGHLPRTQRAPRPGQGARLPPTRGRSTDQVAGHLLPHCRGRADPGATRRKRSIGRRSRINRHRHTERGQCPAPGCPPAAGRARCATTPHTRWPCSPNCYARSTAARATSPSIPAAC